MKFNAFFNAFFLIIITSIFVSCDKDFNEIGANLIDDINYQFESEYKSVLAYSAPTGVVQTNNLLINSLGFYNNPVFGSATSSFVTQLELGTINPKFYGVDSVTRIDSVYLYIPYLARVASTDATTGDSTFELDSIYGQNNKLKLSVFRSDYFLRNLDPVAGLQEQQRYYNDEINNVNSNLFGIQLNNSANVIQNDEFKFTNNQIKFLKTDIGGTIIVPNVVRERLSPGIYMDLDKGSFYNSIFNAPAGKLVDNNAFKDYFRGLFIKAEAIGGANAMARLNFAQGRIVIVYKGKDSEIATDYKRKILQLNLVGNTINFFENSPNSNYSNALANANSIAGDEKLYIKGGQGSMAVIKLFSGNEIQEIKESGWLINEANLVFTIDNTTMNSVYTADEDTNIEFEPNRVHLFDLNNKRPLIDYSFDQSANIFNPKGNKFVHDGIIRKTNNRGTEYKIRLTNHIRNIIKRDSTNVNLGLVVTESINNVNNAKLKTSFIAFPSTTYSTEVKFLPTMSVASPLGTVLWGSNIPATDANYNKRLRLEIFYTKPD